MVRTLPFHGKNMSSILIGSKNNNSNISMDLVLTTSFYPEIFLSFSILIQLIFNVQLIHSLKFNAPLIISEVASQSLFILFCVLFLLLKLKIEGTFSNFLFINDESTRWSKVILIVSLVLISDVIFQSFSVQKLNFIEYFSLLLLALLSMFLLISSYDLISFYLTIEMQALCFYVMASFKKNSSFSTEAGLKYFIAGSFISAFFLLGCSLVYGCLGTLNLHDLSLILFVPLSGVSNEFIVCTFTGILFITSTLLFKLACAPFHFWAPDVYEGSPLVSTIIFSILPKISILIFFIKWVCCIETGFEQIKEILFYIGLFSIVLGTFFSLNQLRLKRLMIYSSVAQVGFIVCAISLNTIGGFYSSFFFLFLYIISSILVWSHLSLFYYNQDKYNFFSGSSTGIVHITTLTKFFSYNKIWAISLLIIFFSIAGIPPLAGFLAKILILIEVIRSNKLLLSILILIISAVGVYYYLRIIKISFFEPSSKENSINPFFVIFNNSVLRKIYVILSICLFFLLIVFFLPTELCLFSQYIVLSIVPF